jgi:hypothetical protein
VRTEDENIEGRLREFRPRRPAALPDERLQRLRGPIWLAVAAGMAAAMLIATWIRGPRPGRADALPASLTLGPMTSFALENPDRLDAALTRMSPDVLPDVRDALSSPAPAKESQ